MKTSVNKNFMAGFGDFAGAVKKTATDAETLDWQVLQYKRGVAWRGYTREKGLITDKKALALMAWQDKNYRSKRAGFARQQARIHADMQNKTEGRLL